VGVTGLCSAEDRAQAASEAGETGPRARRPLVAVIDCRVGNLRSIGTSLRRAGAEVRIATCPEDLARADAILLPGVGAFGAAMENLAAAGLVRPVLDWALADRPFLAVCVGMQLLFDESEEMGHHKGLGLVRGSVRRFGGGLKVPQMGWNTIALRPAAAGSPYRSALADGGWYYFAHSYCACAADDSAVLAVTTYGVEYASVVGRGRLLGTQFHPEKSAGAGLEILKKFVALARGEA